MELASIQAIVTNSTWFILNIAMFLMSVFAAIFFLGASLYTVISFYRSIFKKNQTEKKQSPFLFGDQL